MSIKVKKNHFWKTFGDRPENEWQPFSYDKREKDVERVDMYKAKLMNRNPNQKPLALKTVREKVTSFIGGELHSRQEHLPLVGRHINNAKCEPLHLKNNTTQQLFIEIFKIAYSQSLIDNVKNFSSIPEGCIFFGFYAICSPENE